MQLYGHKQMTEPHTFSCHVFALFIVLIFNLFSPLTYLGFCVFFQYSIILTIELYIYKKKKISLLFKCISILLVSL